MLFLFLLLIPIVLTYIHIYTRNYRLQAIVCIARVLWACIMLRPSEEPPMCRNAASILGVEPCNVMTIHVTATERSRMLRRDGRYVTKGCTMSNDRPYG
jgi:hypothetical protein